MATPAFNFFNLSPNPVDLRGNLLHQFHRCCFPSNRYLAVTLIMAFNTFLLDGIEGLLLLCSHATMAIDTFDHIQLIAWPFLDANTPLPLNQSFDGHMAIFTFDFFNHFSVMTFRTILLEGLSMVFPGGATVRAFQPAANHMGLMGEFDIIERNSPFLHPQMAKGSAGILSLKLPGLIILIDSGQGLLCLIVGCIEEFEGIFYSMNPLPQKAIAV